MTISPAHRFRCAAVLPLLVLAGMATAPVTATAAGSNAPGTERAQAPQLLAPGVVVNASAYPVGRSTRVAHVPPALSRLQKRAGATSTTQGAAPAPAASNAGLVANFTGASLDGDVACCGGAQAVEPPDTQVAAGTSDIVEAVNSVMQVTDKSGHVLAQTDLNNFFQFPSGAYSFTDPRVAWDAADGRWFLSGFGFDSANNSDMKIATSNTSDPTGTWTVTQVVQKSNVIADQPKLGFDSTVVVMAWDDYNGTSSAWQGSETMVLQKSALIGGTTVQSQDFPATQNEFSVAPAQSYDGGTTAYAAENDSCGNNTVGTCTTGSSNFTLISFTGTPAGANVVRSTRPISMNATVAPANADQPGTNGSASIATNDDRFLSAVLSGGTMYVTGNDSCRPSGDPSSRPCVRLLEVSLSGTPSLSVNTDVGFAGNDVYFAAAVPDSNGDVALSATESNITTYPSSVVLSAATGSTSFTSLTAASGSAEYDAGSNCLLPSNASYPCRWGDYAGAAIDPSQSDSLWLASEWGGTSDNSWSTQVSEVSFAATKLGIAAPASTTPGQQFNFTVTAELANGAAAAAYSGTVSFTSSDAAAVLPAPYTFTAADHGVHSFSATLNTRGPQTITATDAVSAITGTAPIIVGPPPVSLTSARQYSLTGSDGSTWQTMDPVFLSTNVTPTSNETAVITANSDLWTAVAGYNQDIGIEVTPQGGSTTLVAWKESGGEAGTYSPNAAAVQGTYPMSAGTAYTLTVVWKTNVANGAHGLAVPSLIYAGAGSPGNFSPTTLTAFFVSAADLSAVQSVHQYQLAPSQSPTTWQAVDPTNLSEPIHPTSDTTMYLSANADMWTTVAGVNQDLGILVSPPCNGDSNTAPTPTVWKESGGEAGTYSPNAAFVQDRCGMTGGTTYTVTLEWKTNVPIPSGGLVYMAAGQASGYSPTTLFARAIATPPASQQVSTTAQPTLQGSNGISWQPVSPPLQLTVGGTSNCAVTLTGNADLWTANAGYNQDIGLLITPPSGPAYVLAWKESGGYAGTFSPNAAFVQGVLETTSSSTYTVTLVWKSNIPMPSGTIIYMGAGNRGDFSPTTLAAQTAC